MWTAGATLPSFFPPFTGEHAVDAEDLYHLLRELCEQHFDHIPDDADELLADAARKIEEGQED